MKHGMIVDQLFLECFYFCIVLDTFDLSFECILRRKNKINKKYRHKILSINKLVLKSSNFIKYIKQQNLTVYQITLIYYTKEEILLCKNKKGHLKKKNLKNIYLFQ